MSRKRGDAWRQAAAQHEQMETHGDRQQHSTNKFSLLSDIKYFMKTEEDIKCNLKNIPILFRIHLRQKNLDHT